MTRVLGHRGFLSGSALKLIAIAAMVVDHIGAMIFPQYIWLRWVGRLTFPIMAFFICEGWRHTRDVRRYGLRLLGFALISELPYNLAHSGRLFDLGAQNIGFTLLMGLLALVCTQHGFLGWCGTLGICLLGDVFSVDYGTAGVVTVVLFQVFAEAPALAVAVSTFMATAEEWRMFWPYIHWGDVSTYRFIPPQSFALFCIPLLMLYSGKRGRAPGWLFYAFYPGHFLVLYFFQDAIYRLFA